MDQEIKDKRRKCILQAWESLGKIDLISTETMFISMPLLEETIAYYLSDMEILKKRYSINDKIQLHKVAGLLANAIVRIKPIVPKPDVCTFSKDSEIYANEILAIYGGLAICSEYDNEPESYITEESWFKEWFDDFIFMLHHRRYTAESLNFIFETVSRIYFPNSFLDKKSY